MYLLKIESPWGEGTKFFARKGDKPEKGGGGGGVDVEIRGVATFLLLYSSIIFNVCEGKVRFPLLLFDSLVF